jgi:hypothetical protein
MRRLDQTGKDISLAIKWLGRRRAVHRGLLTIKSMPFTFFVGLFASI